MADLLKIAMEVRQEKRRSTKIGPKGLCFDWNLELARRLRAAGEPVRFVSGKFRTDDRGRCPTHYWCFVGDVACDVTGDQFNRMLDYPWPAVFVGESDRYMEEEDETSARLY